MLFHLTEPDTIFVLIEQGALLKSTDDGNNWLKVGAATFGRLSGPVKGIAFHPEDQRVMYAGAVRDIPGRRALEAAFRERLNGGRQQLLLRNDASFLLFSRLLRLVATATVAAHSPENSA